MHTRSVMCSIAERMKACRELRFLLMRVLSVLTIVLHKSETFTVRLRITYNQYMHHRETETGYHAALCADKRSSLCKRRRVLKMPSPRMPGNWSVDPCGCPPAFASLQHILQLCAWRVGANAFRTVMDACVLWVAAKRFTQLKCHWTSLLSKSAYTYVHETCYMQVVMFK